MYMFKYIMKRLALLTLTFVIIEIICFVLIKSLPIVIPIEFGKDGDFIRARLAARGYYDPLPVQFFNYLKNIFTKGDFGIIYNLPEYRYQQVTEVFKSKLPPTILLNVYSSLFVGYI